MITHLIAAYGLISIAACLLFFVSTWSNERS
jgi:hypothetical protein